MNKHGGEIKRGLLLTFKEVQNCLIQFLVSSSTSFYYLTIPFPYLQTCGLPEP